MGNHGEDMIVLDRGSHKLYFTLDDDLHGKTKAAIIKKNLIVASCYLESYTDSVRISISVGTNEDSNYFVTGTDMVELGKTGENTGNYFSNKKILETDTPVIVSSNYAIASSAWAADSISVNVARSSMGSAGSQQSCVVFGGYNGTYLSSTEEYNGSAWATLSSLSKTKTGVRGCGSVLSALCCSGRNGAAAYLSETEEYNGTSWSASDDMGLAREEIGVAGTSDDAIAASGYNGAYQTISEEYNGTSWSASNSISVAKAYAASSGLRPAGLLYSGYNGGYLSNTEEYNGLSWASGGNVNTARRYHSGTGTLSSSILFGGANASRISPSEVYDGSSWSSNGNVNTVRDSPGGAGSRTDSIMISGFNGVYLTGSEIYDVVLYDNIYGNYSINLVLL